MYQVDYNSRFFRVMAITTDKYGIDPLKDKIAVKLLDIRTFTYHTVRQEERGAPDLISFEEYGKEDYWWHIMAYNGIYRFNEFIEGRVIKIPQLASIVQLTNDAISGAANRSTSTVTI